MATWEAFCRYATCYSKPYETTVDSDNSTMVTGLTSGGPVSLVYGFIRK